MFLFSFFTSFTPAVDKTLDFNWVHYLISKEHILIDWKRHFLFLALLFIKIYYSVKCITVFVFSSLCLWQINCFSFYPTPLSTNKRSWQFFSLMLVTFKKTILSEYSHVNMWVIVIKKILSYRPHLRRAASNCSEAELELVMLAPKVIYYFKITTTTSIGLMSSVFTNGLGDQGSIPGWVIPKTQKRVLDASLLNTQHYKVRIKGKVEQSMK